MGVSVFYTACRDRVLSAEERAAVAELIAESRDWLRWGDGSDVTQRYAERFDVYPYDGLDAGQVLAGSTKLPLTAGESAFFDAFCGCVKLISTIRRAVPDADWHVHLDDHDLIWDAEKQEYDIDQ